MNQSTGPGTPCEVAIIGGTGLTGLQDMQNLRHELITTPYGEASGPLSHGVLWGQPVIFLPRHGYGHTIPPHKVNYRANLWALRQANVGRVIAVNAVGIIRPGIEPGSLMMPDQILDYTYGREHTYFDGTGEPLMHVDFTQPYCEQMRGIFRDAAEQAGIYLVDKGCYGATQGPRLETAAEIDRMERDGCDLVGMTGMPEAALARELGMRYVCIALVVNHAAGRAETGIHAQMDAFLDLSMERLEGLLKASLPGVCAHAAG
ncbi:MAG: S-methyl-5'-thioinosine phosphorylase [Gammaproteobacteria bacterium]|nr:S-methyl-5'-thioinosine phosphorylase [Gammaproteobacteria bacterium]